MAWIFSQESEVSQLLCDIGCTPSPIVKTTDTLRPCCCLVCGAAGYLELQSGTMCERCGASTWRTISTLFTVDSRARISALQVLARAWLGSARACSYTSRALRKRSALLSSFWKTSRRFGQEDLAWSATSWPAWGTISGGRLFQPKRLEPRTNVKGGLPLLPTPTASEAGSRSSHNRTWSSTYANLHNFVMGKGKQDPSWKRWPAQKVQAGGQLNPPWVEWLMAYPIGWTELEPWATQWYRSRRG